GAGGQLAPLPERDVDGPVDPGRLAELPGAIERVNDPHSLGLEPGQVVGRLFGEHRVARPHPGQLGGQELLGAEVARLPEFVNVGRALLTDLEQPLARGGSDVPGKGVIGWENQGCSKFVAAGSPGAAAQYAPDPRTTAAHVFQRICKSSTSDQFSTY